MKAKIGDNNLDNTFNKEDLSSTIEDYLANEKVFSMDFVRLEKIEDGEEEPEVIRICKRKKENTIS